MVLLFILGLICGALLALMFSSMIKEADYKDDMMDAYWLGYKHGQDSHKDSN